MEFLKAQGKPMHVTEILEGIGSDTSKKSRTALSGSLGWYVRRNEIFSRPAPNTFGLLSMKDDQIAEPPNDLGCLTWMNSLQC